MHGKKRNSPSEYTSDRFLELDCLKNKKIKSAKHIWGDGFLSSVGTWINDVTNTPHQPNCRIEWNEALNVQYGGTGPQIFSRMGYLPPGSFIIAAETKIAV
jgi:hypothetical protein